MLAQTLVSVGLIVAHAGWALSMAVEPWRFQDRIPSVPGFLLAHITTSVLLAVNKTVGGLASSALLLYYWAEVKPLEPIAEPQSVGLIGVSAYLARRLVSRLSKRVAPEDLGLLALRLGIAYPFLEWGLDALRNPAHFYAYLSSNQLTRLVIPEGSLGLTVLTLGVYELILFSALSTGLFSKAFSLVSAATLVLISAVVGYPLALPQNIPLALASVTLALRGPGAYDLRRVLDTALLRLARTRLVRVRDV